MFPFIGPSVAEARVERPAEALRGEFPIDNDALFDELMADPLVTGPDMTVEGNWTQGTIADSFSLTEFIDGVKLDWSRYREVDWARFRRGDRLTEAQGFIPIESAADAESSWGSGDPGIGNVRCGSGYHVPGRAGRTANLMVDRTTVTTARPGERAVAYNCPKNIDIAQLINRFDWGYQARVVAALLKTLPSLGTSDNWRVPAFRTAGPRRSMVIGYNFTYGIPTGVPAMTTVFELKSTRSRPFTFTLRNTRGRELTSAEVDISEGDNRAVITFTGVPSAGMVTVDSVDTRYTVTNTDAIPPVI